MALPELTLALLQRGPAHGYDLKREHDSWFPDAKALAYGQVYATLTRLEKQGLVHVAETQRDGGPERTVFALTDAGRERVAAWLAEPAEPEASAGEMVRKTVAALRGGGDPAPFLAAQRTAHLRRMRALLQAPADEHPAARLARDHLVAHLDADLRWLEAAADRTSTPTGVTS